MKTKGCIAMIVCVMLLHISNLLAQDSAQSCKVKLNTIIGKYEGGCKKGIANGNGEAQGFYHYIGLFKDGLPNGKGTLYYNDSSYYTGDFQDGIKEGAGVMYYLRPNKPDSTIKGYWSGDEYRGKRYITYNFDGGSLFDLFEIRPSDQNGTTVTIDISTTTGSPNGSSPSFSGGTLTLSNLIATDGAVIRKVSYDLTGNTYSVTYESSQFPLKLFATLSDGRSFNLELYKSADWTVRLYKNE